MKHIYVFAFFFFTAFISQAQIVNIPDANFKAVLVNSGFNLNNDDEIQVSEALQVTNMSVSFDDISDLTGIEAFVNLEYFSCSNNNLTTLDLSSNVNLKVLRCNDNMISNLIIDQSLDLFDLVCYNNNIGSLDVTNNINLRDLIISQNNLTSLNLINNTILEDLYISENQFETIDLTNNPILETVKCDNNPLTSLDLSANPSVKYLYCSFTPITSLDFTQNPDISFIDSRNASLQQLLLGNNPSLQRVYCQNNQLTEIKITGENNLQELDCFNNLLTKLEVRDLDYALVLNAQNNPDLFCVEVDDPITIYDVNSIYVDPQVALNTNCSADDDADSIDNFMDHCPNTSLGDTVDSNGCATDQNGDDDNDGVINGIDKCPGTQIGEPVNYFGCALSEIITFLDAGFKNRFIHNYSVDTNADGIPDTFADINDDDDIQYAEAQMVTSLVLKGSGFEGAGTFTNIEGLQYFVNLESLDLRNLNFNLSSVTDPSNFSFTALTNLEFLHFSANIDNTDTINLSGLSNLNELILNIRPLEANIDIHDPESFVNLNLEGCNSLETFNYYNSWLTIDFCQVPSIKNLNCSYLEGGEPEDYLFDFSCLVNLETLNIDENTVNTLILKNGSVLTDLPLIFGLYNFPNFICVDDLPGELEVLSEIIGPNTVVNSYCSFVPGGEYYSVSGETGFDLNANGCDSSDELQPFSKVNLTTDAGVSTFIANEEGLYSIPLQTGNYTLTPVFENLDYFTITPNSVSIDIIDSDITQDFCIEADGDRSDLEIVLVPITEARPGFDSDYKLIYKNKGNQPLTGSVVLNFQDEYMDLINSSPMANSQETGQLTWNYVDLLPFESAEIEFSMNLNTPTDPEFPLNEINVLVFNATVTPVNSDETPDDNNFALYQSVVNSFDPNDKRCLEGETITPDMVGRYVHYMVRFENTGTASAINVVIKDDIDTSKFDINTLIPLDASHEFVTRIGNINEVEFIFENIYLPFDDANNDGFVVFKIKTLSTLAIGDTFSNDAEIYFDFNFPIITNDFITTVDNNLSVNELVSNFNVKLYPNPVTDVLQIIAEVNIDSATIYDVNGRLLQTVVFVGYDTERTLDIDHLSKGVYVVKLSSVKGDIIQKVVKD